MHDDDQNLTKMTAFLERIGIPMVIEPVPEGSFLPGIAIRYGTLYFDPANLPYPGDLLHEAGHIAVSHPDVRNTIEEVQHNPAEEMAALAWSYAAALEIGVDPAIVFHDGGYRGDGAALIARLEGPIPPGAPMLALFGMTAEKHRAAETGAAPFPAMSRWLR